MRIIDALGFDKVPRGLPRNNDVQIPSTRLVFRSRLASYLPNGGADRPHYEVTTRTDGVWLTIGAVTTTSSGDSRAQVSTDYSLPDHSGLPSLEKSMAIGFRCAVGLISNGEVGDLLVLLAGGVRYGIVSATDFYQTGPSNSHYFEAVIVRKSSSEILVVIYRDNSKIRETTLSVGTAIEKVVFCVDFFRRSGGSRGRGTYLFKDIYLAEYDAADGLRRLGPQNVVSIPVKSVAAETWQPTVAGADLVDSLNDYHPSVQEIPAVPTTVGVDQTEGTISLDYSSVPRGAIVNGIIVGIDALGDSGSSVLNLRLEQGGTELVASEQQFYQAYSHTVPIEESCYGRLALVHTLPEETLTTGNVTGVEDISLVVSSAS